MDATQPDADAAARLTAVRPAWTGMRLAGEAIGLEARTILHCGPPATPPHALVQPTLNSAAVACVFEGWADTLDEALALVRSGEVRFEPAQDRGVATPMAAVVSPSMRLIEMSDLAASAPKGYAPINGGGTGASPAPRYGRRTEECLAFLRYLNGELADLLECACRDPVEWLPIVDHGLANGDDTHLRHDAAHALLVETIRARIGGPLSGTPSEAFIREWPFFHLNFWMAAIRCALAGAAGVEDSSLVTAFGGNGETFGLQVSGLGARWFTAAATPPRGRLREPHTPGSCVGAYGDSAIVEALGLGALAHRFAPQMQTFHADFYHDDLLALPRKLLVTEHPGLPRSRALVGLSARRVIEQRATPVIELGIVDRTGRDGGLGAGLYRPPLAPFVAACDALDAGL